MTKHEETPQVNVNEVCRISNGIRLKGDMISQNDIRIDGFYKGNIFTAGKVVLGENGEIEGNVFCANAEIGGIIKGHITVSSLLNLKASSVLNGSVKTSGLGVEVGARFEGSCRIISEEEYGKLYNEAYDACALSSKKEEKQKAD